MRTLAYNGNLPGQVRKPSKASGKKNGRAPLEYKTTGSNRPDNSNEAVQVPETSASLTLNLPTTTIFAQPFLMFC
jgi:hypothetical protein